MSEENQSNNKRKVKLLVYYVLIISTLLLTFQSMRRQVCNFIYICIYTCDEYHEDFDFNRYGLMGGFHVLNKHQCQYQEIVKRSSLFDKMRAYFDNKENSQTFFEGKRSDKSEGRRQNE